ncbi:hypothetical protein FRC00_014194, partial [Tulasnella sp. 408]
MSYASPPPSYNYHRDQSQAPSFSATSNLSLEPLSISDPPTQVAAPPSANFPQVGIGAGLTRSNSRPLPAVPGRSPPPVAPMSTVTELPSSDPFPPAPQPDLSNSLPPPAPRSGVGRVPSPGRRVPVDEPFDSPAPSRPATLRSPPVTSEAPRFGGFGGGPSRPAAANFDEPDDGLPDLPPGNRPGNSSRFAPPRRGRPTDQSPPQNTSSYAPPPVNNNNNTNRPSRLNAVDVPRESLALGWSSTSPPPSHVQRNNAVHQNRSASEVAMPTPTIFYPPQPPPLDRDNGPPFNKNNNNDNRRRGNATSPTSLAFNDINNALSRRSTGPGQRDPPQRGTQRLQVNVQPPLNEEDEWGSNTRPRGGPGSGRPSPSPVTSTSR